MSVPSESPRQHLLPALAFSSAFLGAVNLGTFVWLTVFVYEGNIRGYVPAGFRAMTNLAVGALVVAILMGVVGYRRNSGSYLLGGCLGVPVAMIVPPLGAGLLFRIIGYSPTTDVAASSICAALCFLMAVSFYWMWLRRGVD
jgi:hypothetical protein